MKFKISAETPCIKGMQHLFYFNNCQRRDYTQFRQICKYLLPYLATDGFQKINATAVHLLPHLLSFYATYLIFIVFLTYPAFLLSLLLSVFFL